MRVKIVRRTKLLAISSGGGHWVQLLRVSAAFSNCEVTFVTVNESYRSEVPGHRFRVINDATRWNKVGLLKIALHLAWILWREMPGVVISTGAAPGYIALRLGRLLGARTIWLDSIANMERLSMSGEMVGPYADLWLTQWPQLSRTGGPDYWGAVL
jgi:UDP-N-acetylglucosamine:LPS N-acetylglucosamine transferase